MFWPKLKLSKPHCIPHQKDDGLQKKAVWLQSSHVHLSEKKLKKTKSEYKNQLGKDEIKVMLLVFTVDPLTI